MLGACRTYGIDSENRPQRAQFVPDLQAHSLAMGQKAGAKWAAAVDSQPMFHKSDRLLESKTMKPRIYVESSVISYAASRKSSTVAERLMQENLIPRSEPEDAAHIAQATLTGADYIATWNFAHMVGPHAKYRLVQSIERWGYKSPLLTTPEEILEGLM